MLSFLKKIKITKRLLLLVAIAFVSLHVSAENAYSATSYDCSSYEMGNKMICEFRGSLLNITKDMKEIFQALWKIFMMICAYQIIYIIVKKDPSEWVRGFVEFVFKFMLVTLIAFPNKAGLNVSIPYKVFLEVEELATTSVLVGNYADNGGFDGVMKSFIEVGKMFWQRNDPLKKADNTPARCSDNFALLFLPNVGNTVPTRAQGLCILELISEAAANANADQINQIDENLKFGYGGYRYDTAVRAIKASEEPNKPLAHRIPASKKILLVDFINLYEEIIDRLVIAKKEVAMGEIGITDLGDLISIQFQKISLVWKNITNFDQVINFLALLFLFGCIVFGLCLIGASFFLLTFTPVIVVPIGIIIYQMMWITGVLDGHVRKLLTTYKQVILPFAIGPALFIFLCYFVVAILKTLPKAMDALDSALPLFAMILFAAILVLLISWYAFKLLSNVFKWARDFISLSLQPLLDYSMQMGNVVGSMITGAAKLALMAVTGGAAAGLAGAAAASGIAKSGAKRSAGGGLMEGLKGAFRGGETGNIGGSNKANISPQNHAAQHPWFETREALGRIAVEPLTSQAAQGAATKEIDAKDKTMPPSQQPTSYSRPGTSKEELQERIERNETSLAEERKSLPDEQLALSFDEGKARALDMAKRRDEMDAEIKTLENERGVLEKDGKTEDVVAINELIAEGSAARDEHIKKQQDLDAKLLSLGQIQTGRVSRAQAVEEDKSRLSSLRALDKDVIREGVLEALSQFIPLLAGLGIGTDVGQQLLARLETGDGDASKEGEDQPKEGILPGFIGPQLPALGAAPVAPNAMPKIGGGGDGGGDGGDGNDEGRLALPAPEPKPKKRRTTDTAAKEARRKKEEEKRKYDEMELKKLNLTELKDVADQEDEERASSPFAIIKDSFKDISPLKKVGAGIKSMAGGMVKDLAKTTDSMLADVTGKSAGGGFSEITSMKHAALEGELKKRKDLVSAAAKEAEKDPYVKGLEGEIAALEKEHARESRSNKINELESKLGGKRQEIGAEKSELAEGVKTADVALKKEDHSLAETLASGPTMQTLVATQGDLRKRQTDVSAQLDLLQNSKKRVSKEVQERQNHLETYEGIKHGLADGKWKENQHKQLQELRDQMERDTADIEISQLESQMVRRQLDQVSKAQDDLRRELKEVGGKGGSGSENKKKTTKNKVEPLKNIDDSDLK